MRVVIQDHWDAYFDEFVGSGEAELAMFDRDAILAAMNDAFAPRQISAGWELTSPDGRLTIRHTLANGQLTTTFAADPGLPLATLRAAIATTTARVADELARAGVSAPLGNLAVFAQHVALLGQMQEAALSFFETGEGTRYGDYPCFHQIMAEDSEQSVASALQEHILPLVQGLEARLSEGIDVLDAGYR